MNVSFFQELLNTVAEQGRGLLPKSLFGAGVDEPVEALSRALMSRRGEASGVAIARQLLNRLSKADDAEKLKFFRYVADELQPDAVAVADAAKAYLDAPSEAAMQDLQRAVYSPRRDFFRRLNLAPGATSEIVALRCDLLRLLKSFPDLEAVDADLERLLAYWFNRGFLVLKRIDWQTPASILEKIIAYEAVHEIKGWDDLRRRLDPADRRCFAFFHPALVDDPLIFVEVALMREVPGAIAPVLNAQRTSSAHPPTTAVFYSISNCQDGLRGISFGNFLLKQVVDDLARELPSLKTFVTLSPAPRFRDWVDGVLRGDSADQEVLDRLDAQERSALVGLEPGMVLRDANAHTDEKAPTALHSALLALAAHYFLVASTRDGRLVDPVSRFHLGNGALLDRINWMGDPSQKGLQQAYGIMVNYRYDIADIERNHEAFAQDGVRAASRGVRALLRQANKSKSLISMS